MEGSGEKTGKILSFEFDKQQIQEFPLIITVDLFLLKYRRGPTKRHSNNIIYKQSKLFNVAAYSTNLYF